MQARSVVLGLAAAGVLAVLALWAPESAAQLTAGRPPSTQANQAMTKIRDVAVWLGVGILFVVAVMGAVQLSENARAGGAKIALAIVGIAIILSVSDVLTA